MLKAIDGRGEARRSGRRSDWRSHGRGQSSNDPPRTALDFAHGHRPAHRAVGRRDAPVDDHHRPFDRGGRGLRQGVAVAAGHRRRIQHRRQAACEIRQRRRNGRQSRQGFGKPASPRRRRPPSAARPTVRTRRVRVSNAVARHQPPGSERARAGSVRALGARRAVGSRARRRRSRGEPGTLPCRKTTRGPLSSGPLRMFPPRPASGGA